MPTYDYRCENGHTFELFHSIKDDSPKTCPQCNAPAKRVPAGGGGLLFKGSGFYITDYRSDSYKKGAKSETGGEKSGKSDKGERGGKEGRTGGSSGESSGGPSGGSSGGPPPPTPKKRD